MSKPTKDKQMRLPDTLEGMIDVVVNTPPLETSERRNGVKESERNYPNGRDASSAPVACDTEHKPSDVGEAAS